MKNLIPILLFLIGIQVIAQNARVEGIVLDEDNNEPLPFANIVVVGTSNGTTTDIEGKFSFDNIKPGFVQLEVSYVGYNNARSNEVMVNNSYAPFLTIKMTPSGNQLEEVVVKADPFARPEESPVSMQKLGLAEIETNPGSNRDISRVIQSLPGVGSTPNFRNDIIIRGGGPSESSFYLDGIEIPTINHFATQGSSGGAVGILNADFISAVDFYSGAFPANRGNALSGIFEFTQTEGNRDQWRFRTTVGASEVALTADGPVSDKSTFIISARRSYLQFLFSALQLPFLPTFNDYQLKWKTKFNNKNELTIVSVGSLDQFELNTGLENPDAQQEFILASVPVNNQWSYAIGAVYNHYKDRSAQTFVISRNMLNNEAYKYPDNDESQPRTLDYRSQEIENKFRYENRIRYPFMKLVYSLEAEYAKYYNKTSQQILQNGELTPIDYESSLNLYKYGGSVQASKRTWKQRLLLSFGIRIEGNSFDTEMSNPLQQFSPRFSASYNLAEKWTLNANIGRYYQQPAYTLLGWRDNEGTLVNQNNGIKFIRADHYIAGISFAPQTGLMFGFETFYKSYGNYPVSLIDSVNLANKGGDFGVFGAEPVISTGNGRAYGFEIMNRTRLNNGFTALGSYTFVRSEFTDKNGAYINSSWDFRHIIVLTASKQTKNNWIFGLKWRYEGGLPYTPYDLELSSQVDVWNSQGQPVLNNNELNTLRLTPYHQLDIRIDKKFFYPKWALMLYLDIQNVYNFQGKAPDYVVREQDAQGNYITINNGQNYVLTTIENTNGTILPTVGIMVEF